MQVEIKDTTLILPSAAPFSDHHLLRLSLLDLDPNLQLTIRYLRAYNATTTHHHPFHVISTALSSALLHYYPLAATLTCVNDGADYQLSCALGQGIPLVTAEVDCTLESLNYLDGAELHFVEQLVPEPKKEEALANPCVLQVTMFKCGGFTLGAAIHHALCDGVGGTQFFIAVAELARGLGQISVAPVWERAELLGPRDPPCVEDTINEFLSLEKGSKAYGQQLGRIVRECFHVEEKWLDWFKKFLLEKCGQSFTTFEALGAFIWRAKVRACKIDGNEIVKYAYSINIRKTVKPPLPAGYWGNGCIPMYVQLSARDLVEQPIWRTADMIKHSKAMAKDEYVRSFIDFQHLHAGKGITAGKEVSGFTDWRHLGHSAVDFGWGAPVTLLPVSRNLLGSVEPCFFLPYSSPNVGKRDGFKVLLNLRERAMPDFRLEMEKFSRGNFELS